MSPTIDKFVANLLESKLVSAARLSDARSSFEKSGEQQNAERFADFLVKRQHLTPWQKSYLLKGKTKGFFLGAYKILRILGRGGNSFVYLGEHVRLKQMRAIKVLARSRIKSRNNSALKRFIREARETAKLDHPNVIRCFDIGVQGSLYYLVMEYVQGRDLHKVVRDKGPMDFSLAANCIYQAALGLKYIQEKGLIHRDIKPGNIFATKNGSIKILDLGLALLDQRDNVDPSLTIMHNDNLGTADYLAPEQALNSHKVDHRVDIYGLGCTLYYLLVGKPPFPEGTVVQRIAQHQTQMPTPIANFRPDCPKALSDLCWRMIQKSPENRVQTFDEVTDNLKQWQLGKSNASLSNPPEFQQFTSSHLSSPHDESHSFGVGSDPLALGDISEYVIDEDPLASQSGSSFPSPETMPLNNHRSDTDNRRAVNRKRAPVSSLPGSTGYWEKEDKESDAYRRFVAREHLKMIWVAVGLLLGIGIAVATVVFMRTTEKVIEEQNKPVPSFSRERHNEPLK